MDVGDYISAVAENNQAILRQLFQYCVLNDEGQQTLR